MNNVLDKYLHHYQLKHAGKLKKAPKINFIQGHIASTLVSVNDARDDAKDKPATAMEDDLSEDENDSNFGDDSSSAEDDVIHATVTNVVTVKEMMAVVVKVKIVIMTLLLRASSYKKICGSVTTNYKRVRFI